MQAGADQIALQGTPLPEETLDTIRECRVAIKGPVATPVSPRIVVQAETVN